MAFKGLRFAHAEMRNASAGTPMKVAMAAISIIPLLYGALYLFAFLDPYEQLDTVPVAVVNEDEGALVNGEFRIVGDEVVERIDEAERGLGWHFTSAEEAERGIEDGAYYMVCTIPADFTARIASADTDDPEQAQLLVEYDQASNLLASQIGQTVWKEVRQSVSDAVSREYWTTVFSKINDGAADLDEAADGADALAEGIASARDGSDTIADNLFTLYGGSSELTAGLRTLANGGAALSAGTTTLAQGAATLAQGTSSLASGAATAATGVSDLQSQGSAAVANGAATLVESAEALQNQGTNGVANGAAEVAAGAASLKNQGSGQLAQGARALESATSSLPDQAQADAIDAASSQINNGFASVLAGLGSSGDTDSSTLFGGLNQLSAGIGSAGDGGANHTLYGLSNAESAAIDAAAAALQAGDVATAQAYLAQAQQLAAGVSQAESSLTAGVDAAKGGLGTAVGGLEQTRDGYTSFSSSLSPLVQGAPALKASISQLATGAGDLDTSLAQLATGASDVANGAAEVDAHMRKLADGADAVSSGAAEVDAKLFTLANAAQAIAAGAGQADEGTRSLASGAIRLTDGASQIASGAASAQSGSERIEDGAGQLADGSEELASGLIDANEGADELADGLHDASISLLVDGADEKAEVMSSPVALEDSYYTSVKNYGTGFAPYFISLGLWVGALMASFVFKPLNKRLILSGGNPLMASFASYMPLACIGLVQALLLLLTLQFGLNLQIDNVGLYYAFGLFTALVFAAIMQVIMAAFGFPGKFAAIILLMLQLTSAAGTFPIEQTPAFFQVISPYFPMTYVVEGMRQIMTGSDLALAAQSALVLLGFGIGCFALTTLVARARRFVRMEDLHPIIQLG